MTDVCRAVLFDLDDTLLDGEAAWRSGVDRLLARCPGVRHDVAISAWETAFHEHFPPFLAGELTQEESRAARVRTWAALVAVPVPRGAEAAWFGDYQAGYEGAWTTFADVQPCLDALSGLRLGVITNGDGVQQREKIAALGLTGVFEVVIVSGDAGFAKPDPRIFHLAASQMGLGAGECFFVGDRRDTDAAGALEAGMAAAWLNRRGTGSPDTLVPEITSLADLPALVSGGRGAGRK